eukprot:9919176-Karenia_brevis.AAC.1
MAQGVVDECDFETLLTKDQSSFTLSDFNDKAIVYVDKMSEKLKLAFTSLIENCQVRFFKERRAHKTPKPAPESHKPP